MGVDHSERNCDRDDMKPSRQLVSTNPNGNAESTSTPPNTSGASGGVSNVPHATILPVTLSNTPYRCTYKSCSLLMKTHKPANTLVASPFVSSHTGQCTGAIKASTFSNVWVRAWRRWFNGGSVESSVANLWRHFRVGSMGRGVRGESKVKWSVNCVLGMW